MSNLDIFIYRIIYDTFPVIYPLYRQAVMVADVLEKPLIYVKNFQYFVFIRS